MSQAEWCIYRLIAGWCPVFYVEATQPECDDCKRRGQSQTTIADRSVGVGIDRDRDIAACKHRGKVLQGYMDGCCRDGREVATLIQCAVEGETSVYACYSCRKYTGR